MHDFDVRTFPEHRQDILELLVALWEEWQPDVVFQPSLHDVHQDHQTIAQEGLRAFKRTTILGYEIPWNNFDFAYQWYVALEKRHIERKVAALEKYASQQHRRYAEPRVRLERRAHARHQREPRVRRGVPGVPRHRLDGRVRRPAPHRVRAARRRPATSTSTTPGAGMYAESQLAEHLELLRRSVFGNPHSVNPTSTAMTELVERARAAVLEFFGAAPEEYVADLHAERHGRAAARRRGVPVPRRRPLPAHVRQPQLRERHPRVRARPRRRDDVRAERGARPARRRAAAAAATSTEVPGDHHNLFAYPGAVELLRRPAPARVDRARARARLGRAARRGRVRPDEPPRPRTLAPGLRPDLVLQDVRLADGRRLPARATRRARAARAAVVLGRHDRRRVRAARVVPVGPRRRAVRGRHRQLPQPARGGDRPALPRAGRHRRRSTRTSRRSPRRCSTCWTALRHANGAPAAVVYGPRDMRGRGADRSPSTSSIPDGQHRRRALRRPRRAGRPHLAAHRLLLQSRRGRGRVHDLARDARRRRVRGGDDARRLRPTRSGSRRAARCARRSGSPRTPPTSSASRRSPRGSSTWPRVPDDLPPRVGC